MNPHNFLITVLFIFSTAHEHVECSAPLPFHNFVEVTIQNKVVLTNHIDKG